MSHTTNVYIWARPNFAVLIWTVPPGKNRLAGKRGLTSSCFSVELTFTKAAAALPGAALSNICTCTLYSFLILYCLPWHCTISTCGSSSISTRTEWCTIISTRRTSSKIYFKIYMSVCLSVCLFVCLSDHNTGTPGPICLTFWLGNLGEPRDCS